MHCENTANIKLQNSWGNNINGNKLNVNTVI